MKKIITRVIALALAIVCVFTLVACAKPQTNFEKAQENLEAAGFKVIIDEDSDAVGVESTLTASKGLIDTLQGDGDMIAITKYETTKAAKLAYEDAKLSIEQQIESKKLDLKIAKYNQNKFDADNADKIEDLEEDIDDLKEALELLGRSGKYVWTATSEDAIKATKGK